MYTMAMQKMIRMLSVTVDDSWIDFPKATICSRTRGEEAWLLFVLPPETLEQSWHNIN